MHAKAIYKGIIMRIQSITSTNVRKFLTNNTKSFLQNNADNITQPISDKINFGVGEDYGFDINPPENPDPSNKPGFKKGLLGIATILTFPISVPLLIMHEKYKDKHKDDVKTDMNYDNIED